MSTERSWWRTLAGLVLRILLLTVLLIIGSIAFLCTHGCPDWLIRWLQQRSADAPLAVEVGRVRLSPSRGVVLEDVRVFMRGAVGPAAVEAAVIDADVSYRELLQGRFGVRSVRIREGTVRPRLLCAAGRLPCHWRSAGAGGAVRNLRIDLESCVVDGIQMQSMTCLLDREASSYRLSALSGHVSNGVLAGDVEGRVSYDPDGGVQLHLVTSFDPYLVVPLLDAYQQKYLKNLLERFEFGAKPPRCEADVRVTSGQNGERFGLMVDVAVAMQECRYRGVDVLRADGNVHVERLAGGWLVRLGQLFLVRPEGLSRGGFSVDSTQSTISFNGESAFHPLAIARLVGVGTGLVSRVRFDGPVSTQAQGVYNYKNPAATDLAVVVAARQAGLGKLLADTVTFTARLVGTTGTVSDVRGAFLDGNFKGDGVLVLPTQPGVAPTYRVNAEASDVDFQRLLALAMREPDRDYQGRLSGRVKVAGNWGADAVRTAVGEGHVGVTKGRVFMLPVFGGLSAQIAKVIPGVDFVLRQSDASADLEIGLGRVRSRNVEIKGDVLSLKGDGDYYANGRVDFDVRVTLLKSHTLGSRLLAPIFYPVSKLFEFRLGGTVAQPEWHLINFSSDLFRNLGFGGEDEEPVEEPETPAGPAPVVEP